MSDEEPRFGMEPTDSDVEWIENEVGMGAGAWDMVKPEKIILAAWRRMEYLALQPFRDRLDRKAEEL